MLGSNRLKALQRGHGIIQGGGQGFGVLGFGEVVAVAAQSDKAGQFRPGCNVRGRFIMCG